MPNELFSELKAAYQQGTPFVLCTVVAVEGSSPGTIGQKMIVWPDGRIQGSVGGGAVENEVRQKALELLPGPECRAECCSACCSMTFDLANEITQSDPVCGGRYTIFLDPQFPSTRLFIFGAGHIGRVLAKMAQLARFHVTLIDEREEFCRREDFPEIAEIICSPYLEACSTVTISPQGMVVIATPGHLHDALVLEKIALSAAGYIGLVSSRRKLSKMKEHLIGQGVPQARLDDLYSPVGIDLGSTIPEEIAVEILAQLVAWRNGRNPRIAVGIS